MSDSTKSGVEMSETPPAWATGLDALGDDAPSAHALKRAQRRLDLFRIGALRWLMPLLMLLGLGLVAWLGTPERHEWYVTAIDVSVAISFLAICAMQPRFVVFFSLFSVLSIVWFDVRPTNGWQIGTGCSAMVMLAAAFPMAAFVAYSRRENLNFPPALAAAVAASSGLGGAAMLHVYCGATAWQHLLFFHFGAVVLLAAAAVLWATGRRT